MGWLTALNPVSLALLMILMDLRGQVRGSRTDQPVFVDRSRRARYSLASDSWTRATKELKDHNLIEVSRAPHGSDFDYHRDRNLFLLLDERLKTSPDMTLLAARSR
jgi:hypothetical protein